MTPRPTGPRARAPSSAYGPTGVPGPHRVSHRGTPLTYRKVLDRETPL